MDLCLLEFMPGAWVVKCLTDLWTASKVAYRQIQTFST